MMNNGFSSAANKQHPSTTVRRDPFASFLPSQIDNNKNPTTSSDAEDIIPNHNTHHNINIFNSVQNTNKKTISFDPHILEPGTSAAAATNDTKAPLTINGSEEDNLLKRSKVLTREEVIRRRYRRVKQMEKLYKDHYWALMEELRVKYREYYWQFGKSPFKEDEEMENGNTVGNGNVEGSGENNNNNHNIGVGFGENGSVDLKNKRCALAGCKSKAMALASYCHPHILSDTKQKLYKACTYLIKSGSYTGPVQCGKPILRSTVPSLCTPHFQKAQTCFAKALKRAGLNISSSGRLSPKLHLIVVDFVSHVNARRRERKATVGNAVDKEENGV